MDLMVILFLKRGRGTSIQFCIEVVPIYIPTNSYKGSLFSTSLPTLVVYCHFDDNYSDKCEMVSHFGFYLNFPDELY